MWVGGCQSWYLDADGVPVIYPYSWDEFVRSMATVDTRELTMRRFEGGEAPSVA